MANTGLNKKKEKLSQDQKEGNGNLDIVFCAFRYDKFLHPQIFHHTMD